MIAIIDYGMGNLRSVSKALEKLGAETAVTSNIDDMDKADSLVLPGVGAFYKGMKNISKLNLFSPIRTSIQKGKPVLGICLGFQLLFSESQEHGNNQGLNLIKGKVKRFKGNMKIPHMGWNQIKFEAESSKLKVFKNIPDNSYFYFVHSYYAEPNDKNIVISTTEYGNDFVSAIQKNNIYGVQFHPEKSSDLGMKILKNFVEISENT